ncbi:MAG TPA: HigA family addiction module antitoxin [Candidatus Sulfobium mesophilum]|jgi:addiction module HigA family antidote|nr:HigA family addiction module antitoxin [Candidatus Sulfobium mesophilum]
MIMIERQPIHPGEILLHDLMEPLGITQKGLAAALRTSFRTINEIINGKRGVSPDMALRLAKYFGMSADFWLNAQKNYELQKAWQKNKGIIKKIATRKAA